MSMVDVDDVNRELDDLVNDNRAVVDFPVATRSTSSLGSLSLEDNETNSSSAEDSYVSESMNVSQQSNASIISGLSSRNSSLFKRSKIEESTSSSSANSRSSKNSDISNSRLYKSNLAFLPKDVELISDVNIGCGLSSIDIGSADNGSVFLQDIRKQDRRLLLAEHDCYVRKAKIDDEVKKRIEKNSSTLLEEVRINAALSGKNATKAAVLAKLMPGLSVDDDDDDKDGTGVLVNMMEDPMPSSSMPNALSTSRKRSHSSIFNQINEPFILRTSIYEKYIALSKNLFNEHDVMGTLYLLYYPNHYQDVKQVNRVWTAIPHPMCPGKAMPFLVSNIELMGMNSFTDFLQGLFMSYPDCITCYYSHATAKTEFGMKIVVKLRFTGTLVKPPQQVITESEIVTPHSVVSKENELANAPPQSAPPEILDISGYTTIFFDQNNKVYEVWNDTVVPAPSATPPPITSSTASMSV